MFILTIFFCRPDGICGI